MEAVDQPVLHQGRVERPVSVSREILAGVALEIVDERRLAAKRDVSCLGKPARHQASPALTLNCKV